jgi:hypothetical protein
MLITMAGFVLGKWSSAVKPSTQSSHPGPTVQQIQQLSTLVTTRIETADVQETGIQGFSGGMKVALLVKGDFLLGVNLAEARFSGVDRQAQTAVLWLPGPRITSPRVDHARTRLFHVQNEGLWAVVPLDLGRSAVIERAYQQAQDSVARSAADPKLTDAARRRAEQVIGAFFQALGWRVNVRWSS